MKISSSPFPVLGKAFPSRSESLPSTKEYCPVKVPFCIYMNTLYYFCLVPFRFVDEGDGVTLVRNKLQQLFCALLHFLVIATKIQPTVREIRHDLLLAPLQTVPAAIAIVDLSFLSLWTFALWRKSDSILDYVTRATAIERSRTAELELKKGRNWYRHWKNLKCYCYVLLPFLLYTGTLTIGGNFPWSPKQGTVFNPIEDDIRFQNQWTQYPGATPVISEGILIAIRLGHFILHEIDIMLLVLFATSHADAVWFTRNVRAKINGVPKDTCKEDLEGISEYGKSIHEYFQALNSFSSPKFLIWYANIPPWMAFRFLETFKEEMFPWTFSYNWCYMTVIISGMVYGAEARREIEKFKAVIDEFVLTTGHNLPSEGEILRKRVKYYLKSCGVQIGRFATFSYGLLGSTFSVVLGYSFLIMQIYKSENGNGS